MDLHASLYQVAKLLLAQKDSEKIAELLLRQVLEATAADRGFIVVREGNSYEQKFDVRFDRERISEPEASFSRSLVQQVLRTRQTVHSADLKNDPRFAKLESVQHMDARAVLVSPLGDAGQMYGVLYLERGGLDGFSDEAEQFLAEFTEIAGLSLHQALEHEALVQRSQSLERDLFVAYDFKGIVTRDPKMIELLQIVAQVAGSDAPVLILGETGTGKELIAHALHLNSSRRNKPFLALHCTALPGAILESELFGHVKGAFTGAERDRPGRIAAAAGGTLLLDEVAEIPFEQQAKLLRFLQFGEIQRLGSDSPLKVDVRILAATHQDLPALVKAGKFRQDLYFRLKVLELQVPPLRQRASDIPLLLAHFLRVYSPLPGEARRFSAPAEQALQAYGYPGNVRELAHLVERACLLAKGLVLDLELLPAEVRDALLDAGGTGFTRLTNQELKGAREAAVAAVERGFLEALMRHHVGNVSQAARQSGIHRTYLHKLLLDHQIAVAGP